MATQRIRLKDADGNVLLPETGIDLIRGAKKAPGFMTFGTFIYKDENSNDVWLPAFALYIKGRSESTPNIAHVYYIDLRSGNFMETSEIDKFHPLKEYFAQ